MNEKGMKGIGGKIFWQAHRGGGGFERPDNTLVSAKYAWAMGGIPEFDIRETRDGTIVCLHDPNLARTGTAAADLVQIPVSELEYAQFMDVDVGKKFSPEFTGEKVPRLVDVFSIMAKNEGFYAYLDLKNINLNKLAQLITDYELHGRIWVAGPKRQDLLDLKKKLPGAKTMQWLGGSGDDIKKSFNASAAANFEGLDQIQIHLNDAENQQDWRYTVDAAFLKTALEVTQKAKITLQVFPWKFVPENITNLLDLGISWYVTDEPKRFYDSVTGWLKVK